jgi:hypothetical protein
MPRFDTPEPISVTVELGVGDIRIVASDRTDTIVEVRPSDDAKKSDVGAAQQARVEYDSGRLLVKAPKGWKRYTPRGGGESIAVQIDLPAGSHVQAGAGVVAFHATGRLGECHVRTGVGEIHVDQAGGPVDLKTGFGDITIGQADGDARITTGSGGVRVGTIEGTGVVKNANGDTWIDEVMGDLRVNAANGKIVVDRAHAAVAARTANGDIRIGEVRRGAVLAETALGKVDVGICEGVTAWLDLHTSFGNVHSDLDAAKSPDAGADAVEVRARSAFGDITIRHAATPRATR